jgi:hypothetical protein
MKDLRIVLIVLGMLLMMSANVANSDYVVTQPAKPKSTMVFTSFPHSVEEKIKENVKLGYQVQSITYLHGHNDVLVILVKY